MQSSSASSLQEASALLLQRITAIHEQQQGGVATAGGGGGVARSRSRSRNKAPAPEVVAPRPQQEEEDFDEEEAMVAAVESALAASSANRRGAAAFPAQTSANAVMTVPASGMAMTPMGPVAMMTPMGPMVGMGGMSRMIPMASMNPMGALGPMAPFGTMGTMGGLAPMDPMVAMGAMGAMGTMHGMPLMSPMGAVGPLGAMAMGGVSMVGAANTDAMQALMKKQEEAFTSAAAETLRAGASVQSHDLSDSLGTSGGGAGRSNVSSLAYRPPNAEIVLGITDRRFDGTIRSFSDREGYGFIRSAPFEKAWAAKNFAKNDVFLHRNQKGDFEQGDNVSFAVFLNFRGKPQATDLRAASKKQGSLEDATD